MKKYLIAILLFWASWSAFSQTADQEMEHLVSQFAEQMDKSRLTIDYSFILYEETRLEGKGKMVMQGSHFKVQTGGLDIYSNGKDRWIVDPEAYEVAIEPVGEEGTDIQSNPLLLFSDLDELFDFGPMQTGDFQKKPAQYSILSAKEPLGIHLMKIYFRKNQPVGLIITMEDDKVLEIKIDQLIFSAKGPLSDFEMDTGKLSEEWMINDLR